MTERQADSASLEHLHDIVQPGPVPWWPPAPAWYVLGSVLLLIAVWSIVMILRTRWTNRYRRAALLELQRLAAASRRVDQRAQALARLTELLKRVALVAWPRAIVAPLSGAQWLAFLDRTGRTRDFTGMPGRLLGHITYRAHTADELRQAEVDDLFRVARSWILDHDKTVTFDQQQETTSC